MNNNPEMNGNALKGILLDYKSKITPKKWGNKGRVIFDLKQKFGDGFNSYLADEIYDKIEEREKIETEEQE